jgi:formate-dependent phosphoribosylglycinamide formyltransferase (GAR transformylase)
LLDVAAAARHLDRAAIILQKHDVISEAAEAAEHHIFITGKPLAGTHRRLPLALQDGQVIEQCGLEFL